MIKEACVETLPEALAAQRQGANRIELCSQLGLDGLTPSSKLIQETLSSLSIPAKVMIRPRAGNFVYSEETLKVMGKKIDQCKSLSVTEVILGVLDEKNEIDIEGTSRLAKRASPMKVTFHKSIDYTPNILAALQQLKSIPEITSILTSGGETTALKGKNRLKEMIHLSGNQLTIIPAGRITNQNLDEVHKSIGASEYHGRRIVGRLS